jgi:hypothetical protein
MMRRVCKRLPNLGRDLVNRPLALRQHIDNLSPPSAAKRLGDRREGVKEGILCHAITHTIKLSFEYSEFKTPTQVQQILGVPLPQADEIVETFDRIVAQPLQRNLAKKKGRELAQRNPMIYTVRGVLTVSTWVERVLQDWETSAIEGHLGTWLEEVARIVSGGIKPASGVDLQIERQGPPKVTELYAIQAAPNTKSHGGSKSDIASLRSTAAALRAGQRSVEQYIAVLDGRAASAPVRSDPHITKLGSDDFWSRVSGIPDFRARLLQATTILATLVSGRAAADVARITAEATAIYGDAQGNLRLDVLANPPRGR